MVSPWSRDEHDFETERHIETRTMAECIELLRVVWGDYGRLVIDVFDRPVQVASSMRQRDGHVPHLGDLRK